MSFGEIEIKVDDIINKLLQGSKLAPGRLINVMETEIRYLCRAAREIFLSQPMLIDIGSPVKIFSDIHGQFYDLLRVFKMCGFPPESNYLFLGDSVDRGKQSLETICLLLCYKIKYPDKFFMLRGNHESASISRIYGFYDECKRRHNIRLWKTFMDCFNCLPVAAIVEGQIFCCHGGLSPDIKTMDDIRKIKRPTDVPEAGLLCDLLWSDPGEATINPKKPGPTVEAFVPQSSLENPSTSEQNGGTVNRNPNIVSNDLLMRGYGHNYRGVSYTFNEIAVKKFLSDHDLKLVCRGHEVVEDGYEFFDRRRLVTIFSAPNYCGEFDNAGAVMSVDENMLCSFTILRPASKLQLANAEQVASSSATVKKQDSKKSKNKK